MKIFPTTSIKQLDADTIENEPIASIDLMERASRALARAIAERWEPDTPLTVFAGLYWSIDNCQNYNQLMLKDYKK